MKYQSTPLAERLRPTSLDQYIGQEHLVGENAVLRRAIESGRIPSMIFWGPPGVGKTTLLTKIAVKAIKRMNRGKGIYENVYTNFHCKGALKLDFKDFGFKTHLKWFVYEALASNFLGFVPHLELSERGISPLSIQF